eukprot:TRINITY_DN6379_c0_g4_i14.p1 TRINITY_DN6379_c0_g4~~TRINITY_DN6379_c0_g4_i14.p1  ORF type:complete len:238 (+),score=42.45 TRINITY_DN6379_c0_g4_i14:454-1167(+)
MYDIGMIRAEEAMVREQQYQEKRRLEKLEEERRRTEIENERLMKQMAEIREQMERDRQIEDARHQKILRDFGEFRDTCLYLICKPLDIPVKIIEKPVDEFQPRHRKEVKIPTRVPSLLKLCLSFVCNNLESYEGFEALPIYWKALMYSYMSTRNILTPTRFHSLLDPNQKFISLDVCRQSLQSSFFEGFTSCPMLQKLTLSYCNGVDDRCLELVAKHCRNLNVLKFKGCINISRVPY